MAICHPFLLFLGFLPTPKDKPSRYYDTSRNNPNVLCLPEMFRVFNDAFVA